MRIVGVVAAVGEERIFPTLRDAVDALEARTTTAAPSLIPTG
jgi:hypothetical protein